MASEESPVQYAERLNPIDRIAYLSDILIKNPDCPAVKTWTKLRDRAIIEAESWESVDTKIFNLEQRVNKLENKDK